MNMGRSSSMNKLRLVNNQLSHSTNIRTISTATSSLITKQSSNRLPPRPLSSSFTSTPIRHFFSSRIPYAKHRVRVPINWGIRMVPEKKAYVVERLGKYVKTLRMRIRSRKRLFRHLIRPPLPETILWTQNWHHMELRSHCMR